MNSSATLLMAGDLGTGNERAGAIVAAVVGLIAVALGVLSLARAAGRIRSRKGDGTGRNGARAAAAAGAAAVVLAGVHLATSSGGIGTGNGRAGAFVAAVLGLVAIGLGVRVMTRHVRAASSDSPRPEGTTSTTHTDARAT